MECVAGKSLSIMSPENGDLIVTWEYRHSTQRLTTTPFPQGDFMNGRELSRAGLDEYTELKHAYINFEPKAMDWF